MTRRSTPSLFSRRWLPLAMLTSSAAAFVALAVLLVPDTVLQPSHRDLVRDVELPDGVGTSRPNRLISPAATRAEQPSPEVNRSITEGTSATKDSSEVTRRFEGARVPTGQASMAAPGGALTKSPTNPSPSHGSKLIDPLRDEDIGAPDPMHDEEENQPNLLRDEEGPIDPLRNEEFEAP